MQLGHHVHYLSREHMRAAIEDTGATFHSDVEHEPEMYEGREPGLFGALPALQKERGMDDDSMVVAMFKLKEIMLEMMLPGAVRWLRKVQADAVVCCPLLNAEAVYAAKVVGIPSVSLLTLAGPGSLAMATNDMLRREGLTTEEVLGMRKSYEPLPECIGRLKAEHGLDVSVAGPLEPVGKMEAMIESDLTLVTTCEDLQDPMPPELARAYEVANVRFEAVGPLLDVQGACRAAGHKFHIEDAQERENGKPESTEERNPVAVLEEARAAGRRIILVSMGTVITGDSQDYGWDARLRGADNKPQGLTGRELCQAAWGGAFDAFGAGAESSAEAPLLLVALGPQPNALGDLQAPSNALCLPVLPQVDVLKAGVDVFLTHGGQNSFMEALSVGVPVVVCPGFGDQPVNARKAADMGVGLQVERPMPAEGGEEAAARGYRAEVAAALRRVLTAGHFRAAAGRCAEQLRLAGGVERAVALVLDVGAAKVGSTLTTKAAASGPIAQAPAYIAGA